MPTGPLGHNHLGLGSDRELLGISLKQGLPK